jgi:hypothetical protein
MLEAFSSTEHFAVPALQVFLLMLVNSVCMLLERHKLGLLVSLCFAFYWGFVFNRAQFIDGASSTGLLVYLASGVAMIVVAIVGFFRD